MIDFKNIGDEKLLEMKKEVEEKIESIIFDMRLNTDIDKLEKELIELGKEIRLREIKE